MNPLIRVLRLGIPPSADPIISRRVLLLNLFFLVSALTIIASLVESFIAGEPAQLQIGLFITLCLLGIVPFIARRNSYYASGYIMFLANTVVFFFSNVQGPESGVYLFFFPIFFANGWLMDFRKPAFSILLAGMTLLCVVLVILLPDPLFGFTISREQQEMSFVLSAITSAFVMAINTLVIVWMNYRRNIELEKEMVEKEKASHRLAIALKEKEILLAEIHHRVKNNLAVIRGLLNMQMHNSGDDKSREALRESVSRVSAMALIHQKLYSNTNANSIDLKKYVAELVQEVSASYQQAGNLMPAVNMDVQNAVLDLNKAVPCGLILNELLTNVFKHAFGGQANARIDISIAPGIQKNGNIEMMVTDNGRGIPIGFHPETTDTLGITIIRSLSEQLDGTFSFKGAPGKGTCATVTFPISHSDKNR